MEPLEPSKPFEPSKSLEPLSLKNFPERGCSTTFLVRFLESEKLDCWVLSDLTGCQILTESIEKRWSEFVRSVKKRCSRVEYANWIDPVQVDSQAEVPTLLVPNIFVREYLLGNYKVELSALFKGAEGKGLDLQFVVQEQRSENPKTREKPKPYKEHNPLGKGVMLNENYTFDHFIEGPSNQFIKSACLGVASKPGNSYNPLFIHGGAGLGKTHLLHAIGHFLLKTDKKCRFQCITTESFIDDLVVHLRHKSVDKMKHYFRNLDVLLVDDIQFLQNRLNFEEEFCNTFETLINRHGQIVITSDKPPGQLKLSERMVARMEWGLVAHIGMPDVETRVAILQHKAEQRGFRLSNKIAFYIAERIFNNVRQIEGAVNRLSAYCRMKRLQATEEVVEKTLGEVFYSMPQNSISIDHILNSVSSMFNVSESEIRGSKRNKEIATARQIAMYLAKELIGESLSRIAAAFGGKKHSTLLYAWKKVSKEIEGNEKLRRQIQMTRRHIEA